MKPFILSITFVLYTLCSFSQSPKYEWAKNLGGTSNEIGTSVKADASGNVYTTGWFMGNADFNPGTGIANLTSAGDSDIFISKLDASGNYIWAYRIGGALADASNDIEIDPSGNIYTTGYFQGTVDFNPGSGTYNLTATGRDIFVLKLSPSGAFIWAINMGASNSTQVNTGRRIAFDTSGNFFLTGYFRNTVDFNPSASGNFSLTSAGGADIYIAKYNSSGNFLSAYRMGGTAEDGGMDITVDDSNNVYVTGDFYGTADLDPDSSQSLNFTSAGNYDFFVIKMNATGNLIWAKQMGGTGKDWSSAIAVNSAGEVFTAGYFSGQCDFDPGAGTYNLSGGANYTFFVSKLDASGNFVWAKNGVGTGYGEIKSLSVGVSGNIYTTGWFYGTLDFDPGAGTYNLSTNGSNDIFILKLNTSGGLLWAYNFGVRNGYNRGWSMDVAENGDIYYTGELQLKVDFDPSTAKSYLTSAGGTDVFVLKFSQTSGSAPGSTGIEMDFKNVAASVFPNPVEAQLNIKLDNYFGSSCITLYSELGQILAQYSSDNSEYQINTSSLSAGVYYLKINLQGEVITKKLVK